VLNLTPVPLNLNDNFWGDASGPTQGDEQISAAVSPRVAGGVWLLPQSGLTIMTIVVGDGGIALREKMDLSLTIGALFIEQIVWPIVFIQTAETPTAKGGRIKGPALLESWLQNPVHKEELGK